MTVTTSPGGGTADAARSAPAWPTIGAETNVDMRDPAEAVTLAAFAARDLRHLRRQAWLTDATDPEALLAMCSPVLLHDRGPVGPDIVGVIGDCVVRIVVKTGKTASTRVNVRAGGPSAAAVDTLIASLKALMPTPPAAGDNAISIRFWTEQPHGMESHTRTLDAAPWDDIAANYPAATRAALDAVMGDVEATAAAGRVILWHGAPGTGKTYAVRALARQHAKVASVDYILEPDRLFGDGAGRLTDVLDHGGFEDDGEAPPPAWRILVMEDCDELITADAKQRAGQGLARLLNLTDGLFGQAFKVVVLLTTNEPMTAFHPAIARPGRCGSLVGFQPFDAEGAGEWLAAAGCPETPARGAMTLAELYALKGGRVVGDSQRKVGFHA